MATGTLDPGATSTAAISAPASFLVAAIPAPGSPSAPAASPSSVPSTTSSTAASAPAASAPAASLAPATSHAAASAAPTGSLTATAASAPAASAPAASAPAPPFAAPVTAVLDVDDLLGAGGALSAMPVRPSSAAGAMGGSPLPASGALGGPPMPGSAVLGPSNPPARTFGVSCASGTPSSPSPRLLSPAAPPFHPVAASFGRSKQLWWADSEDDNDDDSARPSFADVVRCTPPPPIPSSGVYKVRPSPSSPIPVRPSPQAGSRRRRPRQAKRRGRRPPELIFGLPLCGRDDRRRPPPSRSGRQHARSAADGRIPVHQRLGPRVPDAVAHQPRRRRFSLPDSDGRSKVLPRQASRPPPRTATSRQDLTPRRCLPALLDGRCLNCLSYSHRHAICTRPMRCMRCFNLHHIAKDCKRLRQRLRTPPTSSAAVGAVRLPRHEVHHRCEASSVVMPRGSVVAGSTQREDAFSPGGAAVGPSASPPPIRSSPPPPPPQLDAAVVCFLLQRDAPMDVTSDPMLLEREIFFSVPPPRAFGSELDAPLPSVAATVRASSTAPDEPTCGDDVVPGSPASSEDRLDCSLDAIQKKPTSPLLAPPARPTVQPAPSEAPKRSSSRLANNKLAAIPITRRGEVLLMRRYDMAAGELDGVFKAGLSGGYADKVLDVFPLRKASASTTRKGVLTV